MSDWKTGTPDKEAWYECEIECSWNNKIFVNFWNGSGWKITPDSDHFSTETVLRWRGPLQIMEPSAGARERATRLANASHGHLLVEIAEQEITQTEAAAYQRGQEDAVATQCNCSFDKNGRLVDECFFHTERHGQAREQGKEEGRQAGIQEERERAKRIIKEAKRDNNWWWKRCFEEIAGVVITGTDDRPAQPAATKREFTGEEHQRYKKILRNAIFEEGKEEGRREEQSRWQVELHEDATFLEFIHDRLMYEHNENCAVDYMRKLRDTIEKLQKADLPVQPAATEPDCEECSNIRASANTSGYYYCWTCNKTYHLSQQVGQFYGKWLPEKQIQPAATEPEKEWDLPEGQGPPSNGGSGICRKPAATEPPSESWPDRIDRLERRVNGLETWIKNIDLQLEERR